MKGQQVADKARALAQPIAEELGLSIWDVEYKKEGSAWFLRLYIDKEGGVDIDDCERLSRAIDAPLDEADFVPDSYFLEVSSPGIDRALRREEHFRAYMGSEVEVRLFKAIGGEKSLRGILSGYDSGDITLRTDGGETVLKSADIADVRLWFEF